eukprot:1146698-Pelagomonas_calceolata.AAC.1
MARWWSSPNCLNWLSVCSQESRESPSPQSYHKEKANGDLEGYLKHPVPEPGCEKHYCFP